MGDDHHDPTTRHDRSRDRCDHHRSQWGDGSRGPGRGGFVLANSAEVGVPRTWVSTLGLLKGAGAVGLFVGLVAFPPLGVAAAIGLIAFFVGAVITHIRARVFYNIAFPAAFLVLAVLALGAFAAG